MKMMLGGRAGRKRGRGGAAGVSAENSGPLASRMNPAPTRVDQRRSQRQRRFIFRSAFQDGHGRGVLLGMAQAQMHDAPLASVQQAQSLPMQDHVRFTAFFAGHFEVLPAQMLSDAGAKRFGDGLF